MREEAGLKELLREIHLLVEEIDQDDGVELVLVEPGCDFASSWLKKKKTVDSR